jgi:error-prone DNA polymerase
MVCAWDFCMMAYAELAVTTNYSFLRGASHPQDLVLQALALGHCAMGIADRNSVAGVVRAYSALKDICENQDIPRQKMREGSGPGEYVWIANSETDFDAAELAHRAKQFRFVAGARLVFADGAPDIIAYPENTAGWSRLCQLLTEGNRRTVKGQCNLELDDLLRDTRNLLLIVMPQARSKEFGTTLLRIAAASPGSTWLAATMPAHGNDRRRLVHLKEMAASCRIPLIAVNDVLYATQTQRDLQDILTCIREGTTIMLAGRALEANAERHLKPASEMHRLFAMAPEAINEQHNLLARISFTLDQLKYHYPDEPVPPGWQAQAWLEELTHRSLPMRYPRGTPKKVERLVKQELSLIEKLGYARYFLTIHDIVRFAESRGILCQGRGSAANSAVCYVLGITCVDPAIHSLLFARFISEERREPPDIDVDFEHERREEVIQYIYEKYGRHRAGIAATVICYRPRSAIREVGKALGLTEDVTARIAGMQWGSWGRDIDEDHIRKAGLEPHNPVIRRAISFAVRLLGFPRHLSQHVGGFILARDRLDALVPIANAAMKDRTFIEWDKDDIDTLGLMKVDILALGMLTCIRKSLDLLRDHKNMNYSLSDVPQEVPEVYDMLCKGDSIGVFQVESRAQINMLPRMKPREFYDLVIEVAIVRPGPIQGNMVHPYLRRRSGLEPVTFPSPHPDHGPPDELHQVLGKTKGVPLFQEQAMNLAMTAAKFTDAEANRLRRAMATFRNVGTIHLFEGMMVERMVARGYARDFAQNCFEQIKGFGSYGFPESHAASFAKLVYVSSWIKCFHPAVFAAALLNSQPMGFYAPAQIVRDACEHGVEVRPIDINHSNRDNTIEHAPGGALVLRLGLRQIDGMPEADAHRLVENRNMKYTSIEDLAQKAGLNARTMRLLADADAFRSMGLDRRQALWAVRRLPDDNPLPLFAHADARELGDEADPRLPTMPLGEHVATDYQTIRLSLKSHPLAVLRKHLQHQHISTCSHATSSRDGAWVRLSGVVLVRQRPGNGKAIFMTLEDETGVANVVLWSSRLDQFRREVMGARLLEVQGRLQRSPEGVVHVMAERLTDLSHMLSWLSAESEVVIERTSADEVLNPRVSRGSHPRDVRVLPKSRDFH